MCAIDPKQDPIELTITNYASKHSISVSTFRDWTKADEGWIGNQEFAHFLGERISNSINDQLARLLETSQIR